MKVDKIDNDTIISVITNKLDIIFKLKNEIRNGYFDNC